MSAPVSLNVPSVLRRAAEGLHSVADNCSPHLAGAMRDRAKEMDAACAAVDALTAAARNVNALSIQSEAHMRLRAALRPFNGSGEDGALNITDRVDAEGGAL